MRGADPLPGAHLQRGRRPITQRIWLPNAILADRATVLNTVEVGDTVFINAYLLATTVFGNRRNGRLARITAEFMGVEAVHRAPARQSNGKLGNDRVFMRYAQVEDADSAARGTAGFTRALSHVRFLESRGLGFGREGAPPGAFYEFAQVSARTPDDPGLSTRTPR